MCSELLDLEIKEMTTASDSDIRTLAQACVDDMGDIFWDYDPDRHTIGDYSDPFKVAVMSVQRTLQHFAERSGVSALYPASLRDEYTGIIADLPDSPDDASLIAALVAKADWTEQGAHVIVLLARRYGTSILRNALALADTLGIEDGEDRL